MSTADLILDFANSRNSFTLCELAGYVHDRENISDSGLLWHIRKLIKQNQLSRLSRGLYGKQAKSDFMPSLTEDLRNLYADLTRAFPLVYIVVYSGNDINSLQHHLSANNAIYVEVPKGATEAVFHYLADKKIRAYHRPTEDFMSDYVDLAEKSVIVKALTTEAPIKAVEGVMMPTLEKILVDINADPDFYYLQGNEAFNIMQNALSLYSINIPKMLRYASRRGIRETMLTILNYKD
jgi:hypothetical protein